MYAIIYLSDLVRPGTKGLLQGTKDNASDVGGSNNDDVSSNKRYNSYLKYLTNWESILFESSKA